MKTFFLTMCMIVATLTAFAQTEGDAGIWYMEGAAYVATYNQENKEIKMEGGTMDEARSFTLRPQNPDDPFFYDVVVATPVWLDAKQAYPDVEDEKGYYIFTNKTGDTQSIMYKITSIALLEDIIKGELASIVEGEYKDAAGRKAHITEGSLQLPGEKGYSMEFGKKGNTPINIMMSNGKCWRFTGTCDGLTLQQVHSTDNGFVHITGAKTIRLIRQNGTMGRWPMSSSMPIQHSMLKYLDKKALQCMREEIMTRLGERTHLTKMELFNTEVIKSEEKTR